MAEKQRKKLRYKYRFAITNEDTFEEVWRGRVSRINVIMLGILFSILVVALSISALVFTSLKEYIPGYPDASVRTNMIENSMLADSLYKTVYRQEQFYKTVRAIMDGDIPEDWMQAVDTLDSSSVNLYYANDIDLTPSSADSAFRQQVEEEEKYNLSIFEQERNPNNEDGVVFSLPMKGVISGHFDRAKFHYGIDLVGAPNQKIMSIAEGTVILAEWTVNSGYVIQIQHKDDLLSIYKHNSSLLKEVGDRVKSGEVVAIIGNTGELSSGAHLHLELWQKGKAIDPEEHILF